MATKETRSLEQLRGMVEAEVRKHSTFNEVTPLTPHIHEPDQDGCNWDLEFWSGPKELVVAAKDAVTPAVRLMREKFWATK